jgi:hypothetical protein
MVGMSSAIDESKSWRASINWLGYISIIISVVALAVSFFVAYRNVLKPFELTIHVDPTIHIQHKTNFGLYLQTDFFNNSPSYGQITQLGLVVYKRGSEEDKFLLTLFAFPVIGANGVYTDSQEKLPLFFQPWQRSSKTMNFIYLVKDEPFPLASGTYDGELMVWTTYDTKPTYVESFKFDISGELLKVYMDRKEWGSTTLEPLSIVGYTPLKSQKLTPDEYERLH